MTQLIIGDIQRDADLQPRAMMNAVTIAEYAEEMENGAAFPPVVVFSDGTSYWLADGFHRVAAAEELGWRTIEAEVRQGDKRDAILFSVQANSTHGLRRSDADKRKAVLTLLQDPEWAVWSDHEIARRTATSHTFVGRLRPVTGNVASERQYVTGAGTVATMNVAPIAEANRQRATEELRQAHPGLDGRALGTLGMLVLEDLDPGSWMSYASAADSEVLHAALVWETGHRRRDWAMQRLGDLIVRRERTEAQPDWAPSLTPIERPTATPPEPEAPPAPLPERQPSAWAPPLSRPVIPPPTQATASVPVAAPAPRPQIPAPGSVPQRAADIVVTARIAGEGEDLGVRRVLVAAGEDGKGPAVFQRGMLVELHRLVDRAVGHVLGREALEVLHENGSDDGERDEPVPLERPAVPFEIGDVVRWGKSREQYGRVESFSTSGALVYVRSLTDASRRSFPLHILEWVDTEEVEEV